MSTESIQWDDRNISLKNKQLAVSICTTGSEVDHTAMFGAEASRVRARGGAFLHRIRKPPLQQITTPGSGRVSYKYSAPLVKEVWRIPRCTLDDLLDLAVWLGFPEAPQSAQRDTIMAECRSMLQKFNNEKPLTISQIDEGFLVIEPLRRTDKIEPQDIDNVINFNKVKFNVSESPMEEDDKRTNWSAKRFFTIGNI